MPMLQFKCKCGHEFEKIVKAQHEIHKWCNHCDRLTMWTEINDPNSELFRQKVCLDCMGNQHVSPVLPTPRTKNETGFTEACPVCGKLAEHVMHIEARGHHHGSRTVSDSSVRFHFNYLSPSDE